MKDTIKTYIVKPYLSCTVSVGRMGSFWAVVYAICASFFFVGARGVYGQNGSDLVAHLEAQIDRGSPGQVLKIIDSLLLENTQTEAILTRLKTTKVDALVETLQYDEALLLSNELLSRANDLPASQRVELWLQQALLNEIVEDFENSKKALDKIKKFYVNYAKDENYGTYLIRSSSFYRVQSQGKDNDSLALDMAHKAVSFGDENGYGRVSGTGRMLLALLATEDERKEALWSLGEALKVYEQSGLPRGASNVRMSRARIFMEDRLYSKALDEVNEAVRLASKQQYVSQIASASNRKAQIFEALGQLDSALFYQKQYKHLSDSLEFNTQQLRVGQLNYRFEIDKRRTAKKETEERLTIAKKNNTSLILLIGLLGIGIGMTLYLARRVYTKNSEIKVQKAEIVQKNNALNIEVNKKEFYLKELNHRVKNNLALILSLIDFQKQQQVDAVNREGFMDLRHRVEAIVLAHEQFLYEEHDTLEERISLPTYLDKIIKGLLGLSNREVSCNCDFTDVDTTLEIALPLGILINELVTNSLKHSEADPLLITSGIIAERDNLHLTFTDSGSSYHPENVKAGLGTMIIRAMVQQVQGTLTFTEHTYHIEIPLI